MNSILRKAHGQVILAGGIRDEAGYLAFALPQASPGVSLKSRIPHFVRNDSACHFDRSTLFAQNPPPQLSGEEVRREVAKARQRRVVVVGAPRHPAFGDHVVAPQRAKDDVVKA